jgi:G3E family GTPase
MAIPALIVSGYLGAGKTTLVAHLLDQARRDGTRLAIISNEFGDTGIDRALLDAGEEGYVELDGGCVCCRLSDALGETLEAVLTRARPDRLVLETSGVALPGEVLLAFWRPPIDALVSEATIVVVVDGERLLDETLDETLLDQVEAADLLLLNQCDRLSDVDQDRAERRLRALSAGQPVLRTVRCQVDADLLFPPEPRGRPRDRRPEPHGHDRFNSFELAFPDVLPEEEILDRVRALEAVRAKGFVRTPAGVRVVQGVGARIELSEPRVPVPESLVGRVVVIRREEGRDEH